MTRRAALQRSHRAAILALEKLAIDRFRASLRKVLKAGAAHVGAIRAAASSDDARILSTLWAQEADDELLPWLQEVFGAGAMGAGLRFPDALAAQIDAIGPDAFDIGVSRFAEEWLATAANRVRGFGDDIWSAARTQLLEGFQAGEGIPDLSKRLTDAFDLLDYQAERIARTEVVTAANRGAVAEMRALGDFGPTTRTWLATMDDAVDEDCADLDGVTVGINDDFPGGEEPGELHPNCRCTEIFGDEADAESAVADTLVELEAAAGLEPDMPWHTVPDSAECPAGKKYAVVKDGTGEVVSCHATQDDANAAMAALYANEGEGGGAHSEAAQTMAETVLGDSGAFHSMMVVEGKPTGDGREFAADSLEWRDLPIPAKWQKEEQPGHDGSVLVGRVDRIERQGAELHSWGEFDLSGMAPADVLARAAAGETLTDGQEAWRMVKEGFLKGVSVDVDDVKESDVEMVWPAEDPEGNPLGALFAEPESVIFHHGRVAGMTLTPMPAFQEAFIELTSGLSLALEFAAVAEHGTATSDSPWDGGAAEKALQCSDEACFKNEYAWQDPAADATTQAAYKFPHHDVGPDGVPGAANMAACSAVIGILNGSRGGADIPDADVQGIHAHVAKHLADGGKEVPPLATVEIVAASANHLVAIPSVPPTWWFNEPVDVPIHGALTITDEGRVYGYLAPSNVAHLDPKYRGRRVPMHNVDYTGFMRGETFTEDEDGSIRRLNAGTVTMGCGHSSSGRSPDHLENTCSIFARIRVGENRHGVWAAGAVVSDITPQQIERAMLAQFSGEWWPDDRGGQILRAALLVPVPGFPMARKPTTRVVTDADGRAMVASAVPVRWVTDEARVADLTKVANRIAASVGRDYASRAAKVAQTVKGA